jgi:hypothetical protein
MIAAALLGGFTVAAPAQAACAPGFTSIPCTIVDNVAQAPGTLAGQGCAQSNDPNYSSTCGLPSIANLANVGCPPDDDGNRTDPCGLPAVPGQFFTGIATLPVQAAIGANQIATAPVAIAGGLAAAPGQLAGGLAAAPKQFVDAITHGGTDPDPNS